MHSNLRTTFSIKPEKNSSESPWQHLRSEFKENSFFGLYGKMIFDAIDVVNNRAEIKELSLLTHEFDHDTETYKMVHVTTKLDLIFDMKAPVTPENPTVDVDSIEQPVYLLKITFSSTDGDSNLNNIKMNMVDHPSILNCTEPLYLEKYKEEVELFWNENPTKMNLNYTLYVDIDYAPEHETTNTINTFASRSMVNESNQFVNRVFGAITDFGKGTLYTKKCRPVYVDLLS